MNSARMEGEQNTEREMGGINSLTKKERNGDVNAADDEQRKAGRY